MRIIGRIWRIIDNNRKNNSRKIEELGNRIIVKILSIIYRALDVSIAIIGTVEFVVETTKDTVLYKIKGKTFCSVVL